MHRKILALLVGQAFLSMAVPEGVAAVPAEPTAPPPDLKTENKEASFHFKKEKIKDDKGVVIGEGKKLPSTKQQLPVPTDEAILDIISAGAADGAGKKGLEFLKEVMFDALFERGKQIINAWREKPENEGKEVPADLLKAEDLNWYAIAMLPKAERRGLGISDEDWEEFFKDYREVMPVAAGKDKDRIEKHVQIYKKKFATVRNDKKALGVLNEMLALYAASTAAFEDNQGVYDYLKKRVETLMQEEEKVLAEAL